MKKKLKVAVWVIMISGVMLPSAWADTDGWKIFTQPIRCTHWAEDDQAFWTVQIGKVIRIDKATHRRTYFTSANTSIPNFSPNGLVHDKNGILWVSVRGGIARFDGKNWTLVKSISGPKPLTIENPYRLAVDGRNNLWMLHGDSLIQRFPNGQGVVLDSIGNPKTKTRYIRSIKSDELGNIWILMSADSYESLFKYDVSSQAWTSYSRSNSQISSKYFRDMISISPDKLGNVWVPTFYYGLLKLNTNGAWTVFDTVNSSIPFNRIEKVEPSENGTLWIVGEFGKWREEMLVTFDDAGSFTKMDTSKIPFRVKGIAKMVGLKKGSMLVSTGYGTFVHSAGNTWTDLRELPDRRVKAVTTLPDNSLLGGGLGGMRSCNIATEFWSATTITQDVYSSCKDGNGNVWVGLKGSLLRISANGQITAMDSSSFPFNREIVSTLIADASGFIWAGSRKGLLRVNGKTLQFQLYNEGNSRLPSDYVTALCAAPNGKIWIGTGKGLTWIDKAGNWISRPLMATARVYGLAAGKSNEIYVGTSSGLYVMDGQNQSRHYASHNSDIPGNRVSTISIEPDGSVWVSANYGTGKLGTNGKWTCFDSLADGFSFRDASVIEMDMNGNVWIGTDDGLAYLRRNPVRIASPNHNHVTTPAELFLDVPAVMARRPFFSLFVPGPGDYRLRVFDLQGRMIMDHSNSAASSGLQFVPLSLPAGNMMAGQRLIAQLQQSGNFAVRKFVIAQ